MSLEELLIEKNRMGISNGDTKSLIDKKNFLLMTKKILKTDETIQFKDLKNSIKEFEILQHINHPSICKTYGINMQEKVIKGRDDLMTISIFIENFS